ncbi:MAG: hypothetical protein ABF624_00830 [Liquorilactobacillus ghanensis]|uniref:hypothetical protein n=1 Tax=Liquorilactobacillus ghanensis TaxID=399370 RepID=UPI0039E7EB92
MSVTITGVDEVLAKLEKQFSKGKLTKIENEALTIGGRYVAVSLKSAVSAYRDTGATVNEVKVDKPRMRAGVRDIKIGWAGDGSKQRWRLVHLNEFGYTRFGRTYSPRGLGKIQGVYHDTMPAAKQLQAKQLRKLVK